MYQSLLRDSRLFDLLLRLDEDLAAETRRSGCVCGGALHSAHYERKPRGGPEGLWPGGALRFSFCCAKEGCRRRTRPPSLRFLGRKGFFAAVVLPVPVLRDGVTPRRLRLLKEEFAVSARTARRWCRFWREVFVSSRLWAAVRGRFAKPIAAASMPGSLLEAFCGSELRDRVIGALRLVSALGTRHAP